MIKDVFAWLQEWYKNYSIVKHKNISIKIHSLDNPGIMFTVNIENTGFENTQFISVNFQGDDKDNWVICFVRDKKFEGACGPKNLSQVITIFQNWIEANSAHSGTSFLYKPQDHSPGNIFKWLQEWYYNHCDEDWEHDWRLRIETCNPPGWQIKINCINTDLEQKNFEPIQIQEKDRWLICKFQKSVFSANCSPCELSKTISYFKSWIDSLHS